MSNISKVAVLGGGAGAHAMAADLASKGLEVNMCEAPEFEESFRPVLERQEITYIGAYGEEKIAKLKKATTDFKEALQGVEYIMMPVPAIGHERFFSAIMPYLEDGQTIVAWPGNYGALFFSNILRKRKVKNNIIFGEGSTLPWGCRLESPSRVVISRERTTMLFATLPAKYVTKAIEDLQDFYPLVACENVLAASLNNLNPIVHPPGCILSAAWIDTLQDDFYYYKQGTTLSTLKTIKAVYQETTRIAEAIGVKMSQYPEESFWSKRTIMAVGSKQVPPKEGTVSELSGPSSMEHRYITEDIPYGLVVLAKLAEKFGIDVPTIDAIIHLASVINDTDYFKEGRSLEELGIEGLTREDLTKRLQEGL